MTDQLSISQIAQRTVSGSLGALKATWIAGVVFFGVCVLGVVLPGKNAIVLVVAGWLSAGLWGAAIYRQQLRPDAETKFWQDYIRLLVAALLYGLALFLILFIVALALILMSVVLVVASGYDPSATGPNSVDGSIAALRASGAIWLLYALLAAGAAAVWWLCLRLMLYGAATIARGKVLIFQTWPWTKGHVLRLGLISLIFIVLPTGLYLGFAQMFGAPVPIFASDANHGSNAIGVAVAAALIQAVIFLVGHVLASVVYRLIAADKTLAS